MKIITQPLGPGQANCYVLVKDHHALLIDPGDDYPQLEDILKQEDAKLDAIVLTHGHFDHIAGLDKLLKRFDVDVYMNPKEFDFLHDLDLNGSKYFYQQIASHAKPLPLHEGEQNIGAFKVFAKTLPGHTIGSTILQIGNDVFTGDVLFQGSVGRVDLPSGSEKDMIESIHYLKTLDPDLRVYPGHGPSTSIGQEMRWNPYFRY
ncbi:MBL fold metallo-hydrolase [Dubosiella newyorkensis]|uniref:Metallo-beta-lactamase domain-containing protein n=3 Tax=Dubosiella newyorkensis TaxID=1862672 RepID=A0A1U7NMG3_9FIRM|nr:MBL fold metallo-hydrolase [Dubosiella newyorkensis]OLU46392.1 hypothetical protein BO225_06390 [Dubosiella newyorkensis]